MSDLFDDERKEFFCPYDGQSLADTKWEFCGRKLRACSGGHIWEINQGGAWYGDSISFRPITPARCKCGKSAPPWVMKQPPSAASNTPPICPDCYEVIRQAWRPDTERSYARLGIYPIRTTEGVIFQYDESVKIEPYPNPYGCGGCWGGGAVKTEAELKKVLASFQKSVEQWQKLGVKVEITRNPKMTRAQSVNQRTIARAVEEPKAKPQLTLLC